MYLFKPHCIRTILRCSEGQRSLIKNGAIPKSLRVGKNKTTENETICIYFRNFM